MNTEQTEYCCVTISFHPCQNHFDISLVTYALDIKYNNKPEALEMQIKQVQQTTQSYALL